MPEALKRIIAFFFNDVKADKIIARHAKENPNSGKVMVKAGMKYFKTLPQGGQCNYGIVDILCYEINK